MDDTTHLGNLLAMIHGDGGHYRDEHGTDKAVADAIDKYYSLLARIEELEPLAQHWLDYQVWLKRVIGEVRQNDVTK